MKFLFTGDVHLGHYKVPSDLIRARLKKHFVSRIKEVDFVVIGGDWYDCEISLVDNQVGDALGAGDDLLKEAHLHNKPVLILRGTISHDRNQLRLFEVSKTQLGLDTLDLRIYNKISVDDLNGLKLGFVPDDLPYSSSQEAIQVLRDRMDEKGYKELDYVFVHGCFHHIFPENVTKRPKCTFRYDEFPFVKKKVICAHIHTPSEKELIIYAGSFDRLRQGEEEAKGFLMIEDHKDHCNTTFIENTDATCFKSVLIKEKDIEKAIRIFTKFVSKLDLTKKNFIRVLCTSAELGVGLRKFSQKTYPELEYDYGLINSALNKLLDVKKEPMVLTLGDAPTPANLPQAVLSYLGETHLTLERVQALLERARPNG